MSNLVDLLDVDHNLLPLGTTPLHVAANNKDPEAVSSLLAHQDSPGSVDTLDKHGRTPLCIAVQNGRFEVAHVLIAAGASLEAGFGDSGHTIANALRQPECQTLLVALVTSDAKLTLDATSLAPMLLCSAYEGNQQLLTRLLHNYEMSVDCADHMGRTSLHYAILGGHVGVVEVLLERGAAISPQDSSGSTPIHMACAGGHVATLELLLQEWVCPDPELVLNIQDSRLRTCAHAAMYNKQFQLVKYLLENFQQSLNLTLKDDNGHSFPGLMFYSRFTHDLIPPDISSGLPPLCPEEAVWTLHSAVQNGNLDAAVCALSILSPDEASTFDLTLHTPLMLAARLGHLQICKALISTGVDPSMSDHLGHTALQHACEANHLDIASFLLTLQDMNLALFFASFSRSLTPCLLEVLLGYFSSSVGAQKPENWRKWLSLAARDSRISIRLFSELVTKICPHDWLRALIEEAYESPRTPVTCGKTPKTLPIYTEEDSPEFKDYLETRFKFLHNKHSLKMCKKKAAPFSLKPPPPSMSFTTISTHPPPRKRGKLKWRRHPPCCYYPLHDAAESGNSAVVEWFLSEANHTSAALKRKLLFECFNDRKQTIVEVMARSFPRIKFDSRLLEQTQEHFCLSLPTSVGYEAALLHCLLVSAAGNFAPPRSPHYSQTPLDKWPLWFSTLRFMVYVEEVAQFSDTANDPRYLSKEERITIVQAILSHVDPPDAGVFTEAGYAELLPAALRSDCPWAVKILVDSGVSPVLHFSDVQQYPRHSWPTLCVRALKIDGLQLGDTFLPQLDTLGPALLTLASEERVSAVDRVFGDIYRTSSAHFWKSRYGPRLVYLLALLPDSSPSPHALASELVQDMVAATLRSILSTSYATPPGMVAMMRLFTSIMASRHFKTHHKVPNVRLACRLFSFILPADGSKERLFLHRLCELGMYDIIQFVLEILDADTRSRVLGKLDWMNMSPLYLAIAKGHLEVVKLLLNSGCVPLHPDVEANPEVFAAVVCLRHAFLQRCGMRNFVWPSTYPVGLIRQSLWEPVLVLVPKTMFFGSPPVTPMSTLSLQRNASEIISLFTSRLEGDLSGVVRHAFFLTALGFLASLPSLDLSVPLLRVFLQSMELCTLSSADKDGRSRVAERVCHIVKHLPKPSASSRTSLQLVEEIFLKLIDWDLPPPMGLLRHASSRGLWDVVSRCLMGSDLSCVSGVLCDAVGQGNLDALASVCKTLHDNGRLQSGHMIQPLCEAVRLNREKEVETLLTFELDDSLIDLLTPLCKSIWFHRDAITTILLNCMDAQGYVMASREDISSLMRIAVKVAARCNNSLAIEELLTVLLSKTQQQQVLVAFWWCVLSDAAEFGHEALCLQAVACLPEAHIQEMPACSSYLDFLRWCCFWGMKDVLECIPCTTSSLLHVTAADHTPGHTPDASPWVYAVVGGHVGKLSYLPCFPSLETVRADAENNDLMNIFYWNMLFGAFHKVALKQAQEDACHNINTVWSPLQTVVDMATWNMSLLKAVRHKVADVLETYLEHLGKYAGEYIIHLRSNQLNLLLRACMQRDNLPVVELILKSLFESDQFSRCDVSTEFSYSVRTGELGYAQTFVRCFPGGLIHTLLDCHALLSAVHSGNPKMVDYILDLLGSTAPDACYQSDRFHEYPLHSAFVMGKCRVINESSLMERASDLKRFGQANHPSWKRAAEKCFGWLDILMRSNANAVTEGQSPGYLNVRSTIEHAHLPMNTLMSLRSCEVGPESKLLDLLELAVAHKCTSAIEALVAASDGVFCYRIWDTLEVGSFSKIVADSTVWKCLHEVGPARHRQIYLRYLDEQDEDLVESVVSGQNADSAISLIERFQLNYSSVFLKDLFLEACDFGREKFIEYVLSNSLIKAEHFSSGLWRAYANGHTKVAAILKLRTLALGRIVSPLDSINPIHKLIFSGQSYYTTLNQFFKSLLDKQERLPLASRWMVHNWSEQEAEMLSDTTYAPPNPWVLPADSAQRDLTVTVDWDSFSESLLATPSPNSGSKFSHVPLLVEAIVFSSAVLGQLTCSSSSLPTSETSLRHHCEVKGLSSVIVSCVVSPSLPSFSVMGEQAILTLSYQPNTRTVIFPELSDAATPTHGTIDSAGTFQASLGLQDLGSHFEKLFGMFSICNKRCRVTVHFSAEIHETSDRSTLDLYATLVPVHLSDIANALKLVSKPSVLYKELCDNYTVTTECLAGLSTLDDVTIQFETSSSLPLSLSTFDVSVKNSVLFITVQLPREANGSDSSEYCSREDYSKLLDRLVKAILEAEVAHAKTCAVEEIGRKVALLLNSSLGLTPSSDVILRVQVAADDEGQAVTKLADNIDVGSARSLACFKSLFSLCQFLCTFCRTVSVFRSKQRLHTQACSFLESGFTVTLSHSPSEVPVLIKNNLVGTHLRLPIRQLLSGSAHSLLPQLFRDLLLTWGQEQYGLRNFLSDGIPALFRCYVDLNESLGLLYPVEGKAGAIVMRMIDFDGVLLSTTPPGVNYRLDVCIRHVSSRCVVQASSDTPHSADGHLLVTQGTHGEFNIEWTPHDSGMYLVSLHINNVEICDSPYKCHSAVCVPASWDMPSGESETHGGGVRYGSTDSDPIIVCVVSHCNWCDPSSPPPVRVPAGRKPMVTGAGRTCTPKDPSRPISELKRGGRVHHISMCSAYGGARKWCCVPSPDVSLHVKSTVSADGTLPDNRHMLRLTTFPLGSGHSRVSIRSVTVGMFYIFASCPRCSAVLNMHWKDGRRFLPSLIHVLPGCLSLERSTIKVAPSVKGLRPLTPEDKRRGLLLHVVAGTHLLFTLTAMDRHGNSHTSQTITAIAIPHAGRRGLPGTPTSTAPGDVTCDVRYKEGGKYAVSCQVFSTGTHAIIVTDSHQESLVFGKIRISSGPPHGSICRLSESNSYHGTQGVCHTLSLELFDKYMNPTHCKTRDYALAMVGSQRLKTYTGMEAFRLGFFSTNSSRFLVFVFTPEKIGQAPLVILINGTTLPTCPVPFIVQVPTETLSCKLKRLRDLLRARYGVECTHTLTMERGNLLESAVQVLQEHHFSKTLRVRFGDENGIDMGGISKEFFHLLSMEFVNPNFALFQCVNGLYKPSPHSSANENHLFYFRFFGKILAKALCDGHQIPVRFVPSVYKYILEQDNSLDDLQFEEPTVHRGLVAILACEKEEELEMLASSFTTTSCVFGHVQTVELEQGGRDKRVTIENRGEFVQKLHNWLLTGCISEQLEKLRLGFTSLIHPEELARFTSSELELVLSGQSCVSIPFIQAHTKYTGYSHTSSQVQWLWEVLGEWSHDDQSTFLQFCTGCGCLPIKEVESWEFKVQRGSDDCTLLPTASTCFNSITLPLYHTKAQLNQKLLQAVLYGNQEFLCH